tara:strand:- start:2250 stop:2888 length:639 start_codon:yes stop_codon:yes gene_type:complete
MLPFLEELRYVTTLNYRNNSNVGWVGINWFGSVLTEEEYAVYPDSDSEEEEYAMYNDGTNEPDPDEHEDCYCHLCERPLYEQPITRLQKRTQKKLINKTILLIECLTEEINCWFNYMEEQKHYTKEELDKIFDDSLEWDYVTEQEYKDKCDDITKTFKNEKANIIYFNDISCIQLLMADNAITGFINLRINGYEKCINTMNHLRKITLMIQK